MPRTPLQGHKGGPVGPCTSGYIYRVKRIAVFLLVVAVAASALALAWRAATSDQQRWAKDRIKVLLGRNPKPLAGPPPPAAQARPHGGEGLVTGDDPPFAYASGAWSMVTYGEGDAVIRPNLRFDFELPPGMDTSRLGREWARSGTRSYRMGRGDEYSPAVRRLVRDVAINLSAVEVGLWAWSPSPSTLLTVVVSIDRAGKQVAWFGKDLLADPAAKAGQRVNAQFLVRDTKIESDDVLSVYLWKRGGAEAFIDDMDIFFHSDEVPGRAQGRALALDSLLPDGPRPLHYAQVSITDVPVDTARFRVGGTAPATTVEAVPIGGTPRFWRFVPEEGTAWLQDAGGEQLELIRPWSTAANRDITHYDRVVATPLPQGLLLTGYDVEHAGEGERIAGWPAPLALKLEIIAE
ncbi:MAG TPA: hypothetical protein PKD45_05360 [Flavobacteriales bacterium]|mgnify:CR=1 FL=1|nr:hypothetical protein [Flavobacteriales bacterium]